MNSNAQPLTHALTHARTSRTQTHARADRGFGGAAAADSSAVHEGDDDDGDDDTDNAAVPERHATGDEIKGGLSDLGCVRVPHTHSQTHASTHTRLYDLILANPLVNLFSFAPPLHASPQHVKNLRAC
jgi:hypothetical protein